MKQSPLTLPRAAVAADLAELLRLEQLFPGDRLTRRQLRHHIGNPLARLRVLSSAPAVQRELSGYSLMFLRRGSRRARLYSLVVDPVRRGQGIGGLLLADVAAIAAAAECSSIRLEVRADNVAAIALYVAAGYRQTGTRPNYYDDGEAAVCMAVELVADAGPAAS